jgi:hypothetical protein
MSTGFSPGEFATTLFFWSSSEDEARDTSLKDILLKRELERSRYYVRFTAIKYC